MKASARISGGRRDGPNIATIAALIGDPGRAAMLTALMTGKALTATELAHEASVGPATASSHLAKLEAGKLVTRTKQGRHRYYRLSDADVAGLLESLMGVAARAGHLRTRTGPRDPALRHARVCYDHLAGDLGVGLFEGLLARGLIAQAGEHVHLTDAGAKSIKAFGIDPVALQHPRRALCKPCLDWSERKSHLGGSLGRALLARMTDLGWAKRMQGTRIVAFTPVGERALRRHFGLPST
jgi:DNA-binding transcriptional ArsR family regulator